MRPEVRGRYLKGVLWSPSYFAASCGGAPISILKRYVEQQREDAPPTRPKGQGFPAREILMINHFDMAREWSRLVEASIKTGGSDREMSLRLLVMFPTMTEADLDRAKRILGDAMEMFDEEVEARRNDIDDLLSLASCGKASISEVQARMKDLRRWMFGTESMSEIDAAYARGTLVNPTASLFPKPDKTKS